MKKYLLFIALVANSFSVNAASELDEVLLKEGIVNKDFQIIEFNKFNEMMRTISNNIASMFPSKIDANTTILSMNASRFGIYINYQLEEVETKKDAEFVFIKFGLAEKYKNYLCTSALADSETFKKLNAKFNINFLNTESRVIYNINIPISSC